MSSSHFSSQQTSSSSSLSKRFGEASSEKGERVDNVREDFKPRLGSLVMIVNVEHSTKPAQRERTRRKRERNMLIVDWGGLALPDRMYYRCNLS